VSRQAHRPRWNAAQARQACPVLSTDAHGWRAVHLPADIRARASVDAGDLIRAAWVPGVKLIIADTALVEWWDARGLENLLGANHDLAGREACLRLVVWSRDLYEAVQHLDVGGKPSVYTSIDAALRSDRR
jgi:hypothetical protein